ncbi:MAG: alpha-glucan family phosphorylase [Gaiellaceae bacterium]
MRDAFTSQQPADGEAPPSILLAGAAAGPEPADEPSWWQREHAEPGFLVAYLSMEFGLHESLPLYAGGLGILAGDHLKAAADLGVPVVGVGLFYRHGYFRQVIDAAGRQIETYPPNDPARLSLTAQLASGGEPLLVEVEMGGEVVRARIWKLAVGRVPLYLLDSEVDGNSPAAREITDRLYGGDSEHRLRQELLLGVGGARALTALGLVPTVVHINEGHAAFASLERARRLVESTGLGFTAALERVRASTVFTTHTPVPAGNERFALPLARSYLDDLARRGGSSFEEIARLASGPGEEGLGMTQLALRTAGHANAVSELHGQVARRMWAGLWPGLAAERAPIGHVTNGVHAPSWVSAGLAELLEGVGVELAGAPGEQGWERAGRLQDDRLWAVHRAGKAELLEPLGLDPLRLTIGFARRFTTYKRAGLLFSDAERLLRLVADEQRPLQIVLAGKAHPRDEEGKAVLASIAAFARDPRFAGRVVLLENYDIGLARRLVQGVDVWLNTPRRLQEASGTSGMKAGMNGVLNLSVRDGWWAEAFAPQAGWAIGDEVSARGDEAEAQELFRLLEQSVLPAYYELDSAGLPARWLGMMKASIALVGERFSAGRMVAEYAERYYLPAHRDAMRLAT